MWDTWFTLHGGVCGGIFWHIMCSKVSVCFSSDVDTAFESGVGGVFEVWVEDSVCSEHIGIVNNYRKGGVDLDIGDSAGWGGVRIDDSK